MVLTSKYIHIFPTKNLQISEQVIQKNSSKIKQTNACNKKEMINFTWLNSRKSDLNRILSPLSHRISSETPGMVSPPGITMSLLFRSSSTTNLSPGTPFADFNLKSLVRSNPNPRHSRALIPIGFSTSSKTPAIIPTRSKHEVGREVQKF